MSPGRAVRDVLSLSAEAAGVFLLHNFVEPFRARPSLPRTMVFIATHRCNARCVMCGIWKQPSGRRDELAPNDLSRVLVDRLFSRIRYVVINGGEPFLRGDLAQIVAAFHDACPDIRRVSLTTNGLLPRQMAALLPEIADTTQNRGALLDVAVSIHALGDALDDIYGVARAFEAIEESLALLTGLRDQSKLTVSLNCVLLDRNVDDADDLRRWAGDRGFPIRFVVGEQRERFFTRGLEDAFVDGDDRSRLVEFLLRMADARTTGAQEAIRYRELAAQLDNGAPRTLACSYAMGGVLVGPDGRLYYCPHSKEIGSCENRTPAEIYYDPVNLEYRRRELLGERCLSCPPYTRTRWEIEKDLVRMLPHLVRRRLRTRAKDRQG